MIDFQTYLQRLRRPAGRIDFAESLRRLRAGQQPGRIFSGGPLSDVFDALSVGQYAAAGLATGKGIQRGIEERTSYGELFSPSFRRTLPGRVAEFGANVLGDPLTYIPVGGLAARGLRALPGGAHAISAAKAPVRALAERTGFAVPEVVRAAKAVEGLAETKLEPLREVLRGVRSEQALARIEAARFSRDFQAEIRALSRGNPAAATRLRQLATRYFDVPADNFVGAIRRTDMPGWAAGDIPPETMTYLRAAKRNALQARHADLEKLAPPERAFVEKWGGRVAEQHKQDLSRLVDLKLLTPERAELWEGIYLRNTYLKHLNPEQYADLLAKTDPKDAAAIMAGVERGARLRGTAAGIPGRAQIRPRRPLTETQRGRLGLLRNLDERYAVQRTMNAELISRGELNGQVARLYALPEEAVDTLSRQVPDFHRIFRPMPSEARWGELAGRWVPKEVHDTLTAIAWKPEGAVATFTKLVSAWKLGKVAMPGTIRRNLTSNFSLIQSRFGTRGLGGVLREIPEAFNDVRNASELYLRAVRAHPGFGSTHLDAEVRDLLRAAGTPAGAGGMADAIVNAVQKVGRPFTTSYEFSELVPKMAVFRWGLKRGLSDKGAAVQAVLTLFDYGDVPPAILTLRRYGLWPFVTFPYKVLTTALPRVAEHPGLLAQQVKLIRALTVPETEQEKRAMPLSLRSGGYVKMPVPDWKGRANFYDLSYELFFGDLGEPGTPVGQVVAMLQGRARPVEVIPTFLTPMGQVAAEIAANKSFFTGQEVVRPEEPALLGQARHVARAMLPGPVFATAETAATPLLRQAGLKPSSVLARAAYGVPTSRGIAPPSLPAAAAQTFGGFRTVPLDVPRQTQANIAGLRAAVREINVRMAMIRRDKALRPAEKAAALRRLREQRQKLLQQFASEGAIR